MLRRVWDARTGMEFSTGRSHPAFVELDGPAVGRSGRPLPPVHHEFPEDEPAQDESADEPFTYTETADEAADSEEK